MKRFLLILIVLVLISSFSFAAIGNICENIHVSTNMQTRYFGESFGQEVCLSGFQSNTYFVNYSNGDWTWVLHECTQPAWNNNLLRFFVCGGLN